MVNPFFESWISITINPKVSRSRNKKFRKRGFRVRKIQERGRGREFPLFKPIDFIQVSGYIFAD
jgi:hypothetical protein